MKNQNPHIKLFLKKLKEMHNINRVKFVILFGSYSQGKENKLSDIDFAVYYEGNKKERYEFRKKILIKLPDIFDVQIFQDLPLYVRISVLKGKLIYMKDTKFVYDIAYKTIKDFEMFKKYYYDYINNGKIRI
ncbi:nucleotidyltransferase domain-containing protein [Candidatus Pacearchaeota archaeon]|nr:nucleotidyltransferase domain-containing protein [Candidatus Pacearchaeota archaeon]